MIYKDIVGYEGLYQVSDDGYIKSLSRIAKSKSSNHWYTKSERILKHEITKYGYARVQLLKDGIITRYTRKVMMKKLIIVRGLPGSGKSTFAKSLIAAGIATAHCEADQFFTDEKGNYNFNMAKLPEAHKDCLLRTIGNLNLNNTVVVSNTFTTEKELAPYIEYCQKNNIPFLSIIVENRHGNKSIHNVPGETMDKMRNRFSTSLNNAPFYFNSCKPFHNLMF